MSFTELLRSARSSRVSVLHRFLTNYIPGSARVYAFVEGEPDRLFYRHHIEALGIRGEDLFVYSCEGKASVYSAYSDIVARYPNCVRTLFFVDKDIDDIVGRQWPTDPRIFVTQVYSVENYVVCRDAMKRYFTSFAKVRKLEVSLDSVLDRFEQELKVFYRMMLPIMAWIVFVRRGGNAPNLNNIDLGDLFEVADAGVRRRRGVDRFQHIRRVTQVERSAFVWRQVRATCRELRRVPPKRYVRGKFEAWFFVNSGMRIADGLRKLCTESGTSVAFSAQLTASTFIQLLSSAVPAPTELSTFLRFHLSDATTSGVVKGAEENRSLLLRGTDLLSKLWS